MILLFVSVMALAHHWPFDTFSDAYAMRMAWEMGCECVAIYGFIWIDTIRMHRVNRRAQRQR